ncbi:hypothetical protein IW140_003680 [Coemansia sp. RSA 1813]|nr:hypothetical protein EV178_002645 [Coemansia sp. RSA 1646]KAJ1770744.1 hypothetical protein LPJ74_002947 [Coemansia sp. RSA 1843]KAJ2088770.1 hypothetical protein IW138_003944 [Coemansia sp. RSA 986]KAJ2213706.1 hypothetical protein EV179_003606 [Coemansia sp. RSA 487]KAJ2568691.1 hypothetical protein IW140_003680 [Coemansia sp. RSA 1813]
MRFSALATVLGLVSCVAAAPYYGGDVTQVIGVPPIVAPPVVGGGAYPGSGATYPGGGSNGSGNNGAGNNGSGNNGNGSGNNGNGSGGNGSNGNGSGGSGSGPSGGQVGKPADCGLSPGQTAALTPLVNELQLTRTVDDLKHLTKQITDLLADTLQESAVSSILNIVDNVVAGLGLGGLDLKPTVDSVTSILRKQVPCVLDTLLPKP